MLGLAVYRSIKACVVCNTEFKIQSPGAKYCPSCNKGRVWDQWSLDPRRRLQKLCSMAKNRSRTKKLAFDLDAEYLFSLWEDQEGRCALTGIPFDLEQWGTKGQVNPNTVSVDRIIPSLGYVKGNVRLITYHLNIALSEFGQEQFKKLAEAFLRSHEIA